MTGTPIPAGALTVDDVPSNAAGDLFAVRLHDERFWCWVTFSQRARLLAGPDRPTGVPDDAPEARVVAPNRQALIDLADRLDQLDREHPDERTIIVDLAAVAEWRDRIRSALGVPPYQPDPDPADAPDETCEVCPACEGSPEWPSLRPEGGSLSCRFCNRTLTWIVMRDRGPFRCSCKASREAACPKCHGAGWVAPDPTDSPSDTLTDGMKAINEAERRAWAAPPVAAGGQDTPSERTGPLGLSERDTRYVAESWNSIHDDHPSQRAERAFALACDAAVTEWDAEPQPAETHADIVAWCRTEARRSAPLQAVLTALADRIEAASRPDHDTITVNLPRTAVADAAQWENNISEDEDWSPAALSIAAACRAALAAAGLPQEPTATRPRPTLKEQRAHLDEGSCGCHDSWDQCPCAEGGHPADGSCNCCPLGTGLCGPLPQEPTEPEAHR